MDEELQELRAQLEAHPEAKLILREPNEGEPMFLSNVHFDGESIVADVYFANK